MVTSYKRNRILWLTARTLVEWDTPTTTVEYKNVLNDLLSVHRFAKSFDLTIDKPFLKLDKHGTILWYLSETLDTDKSEELDKLINGVSDKTAWYRRMVEALVDYGTSESTQNKQWRGTLSKFRVADTIIETIRDQNPELINLGIITLISILVPLDPERRKNCFDDLRKFLEEEYRKRKFGRQIKPRKRYYKYFLSALVMATTIAGLYSLSELIKSKSPISLKSLLISSYIWTKCAIVGTIACVVTIVKRKFFEDKMDGIMLKRKLKHMLLDLYTGGCLPHHRPELHYNLLSSAISEEFGSTPEKFRAILQSSSKLPWKTLALTTKGNAKIEVIRDALKSLRDPDTDDITRQLIFRWLCNTSVIL